MTEKIRTGIAALLLFASTVTVAACGGAQSPAGRSSAETASPKAIKTGRTTAPAATPTLLVEVDRELDAMRVTHYQHATRVDEASGRYEYDCSGLLDYALTRVLPADGDALPTSTSIRPLAADIERYLHQGLTGQLIGWQALVHVADLRPGDVIAWLATEDSETGDTGHVMVVHGAPAPNPDRPDEWLVQVVDSTLNPHARDSRKPGQTGLGTGTIGLVADGRGDPIAFYWQGASSQHSKATEIALGRPV